ncbi:MAG: peptide deformylase [Verrucomicrobiae bacterium]|nr:peptide deformylase [Verrucomicrobiae bacterium]
MVLEIVKYGHPALRTPGARIEEMTPELRQFAEAMIDAMRKAEGVGLAAQQVARPIQLCVLDVPQSEDRPSTLWIGGQSRPLDKHMPMVLINPEVKPGRDKVLGTEGCLSFPEISAEIRRPARCKVTALDIDGKPIAFECDGLLSRAIQHEVDHLKGILFIDRMDSATKHSLKRDIQAIQQETLHALKAAA